MRLTLLWGSITRQRVAQQRFCVLVDYQSTCMYACVTHGGATADATKVQVNQKKVFMEEVGVRISKHLVPSFTNTATQNSYLTLRRGRPPVTTAQVDLVIQPYPKCVTSRIISPDLILI